MAVLRYLAITLTLLFLSGCEIDFGNDKESDPAPKRISGDLVVTFPPEGSNLGGKATVTSVSGYVDSIVKGDNLQSDVESIMVNGVKAKWNPKRKGYWTIDIPVAKEDVDINLELIDRTNYRTRYSHSFSNSDIGILDDKTELKDFVLSRVASIYQLGNVIRIIGKKQNGGWHIFELFQGQIREVKLLSTDIANVLNVSGWQSSTSSKISLLRNMNGTDDCEVITVDFEEDSIVREFELATDKIRCPEGVLGSFTYHIFHSGKNWVIDLLELVVLVDSSSGKVSKKIGDAKAVYKSSDEFYLLKEKTVDLYRDGLIVRSYISDYDPIGKGKNTNLISVLFSSYIYDDIHRRMYSYDGALFSKSITGAIGGAIFGLGGDNKARFSLEISDGLIKAGQFDGWLDSSGKSTGNGRNRARWEVSAYYLDQKNNRLIGFLDKGFIATNLDAGDRALLSVTWLDSEGAGN